MMPNTPPEQWVSPTARGHALGFIGLGLAIFAVAMLLLLADLPLPTAAYALLFIAAAAVAFLGIAKLVEPKQSMRITPEQICYLHWRGRWCLDWTNVVRFDVPRVQPGFDLIELPYIGFRVHDIEPILDSISPRLAVYLVSEQRHILTTAIRSERPDTHDYSKYFEVPEVYTAKSGKLYRGVSAMFAKRCEHVRELLGYDLYIPASALDRPADEFINWLHQLQQHRPSNTD